MLCSQGRRSQPCRCRSAWINKQINIRTMGSSIILIRKPFFAELSDLSVQLSLPWIIQASYCVFGRNPLTYSNVYISIVLRPPDGITPNKLWLTKWLALKCLWVDRGRMKAPVDRSCVINEVVRKHIRLRKGKRARCGYVRDIYSIIFLAGTSTASRKSLSWKWSEKLFGDFLIKLFHLLVRHLNSLKCLLGGLIFLPPILCAGKA